MKIRVSRAALMAAVSSAALVAAPNAFAQENDEDQPSASRSVVDTIVVTAQKREQNVQDIPVSVSVINAELAQNAGIRDIKDLAVIAPGLNVTSTTSEFVTTARIRGIGTVGDNPGLESSVGIVIDGVPRARNGVGFNDLGEIERIEVLRGPQGTLFGRNTSAGLINIVTAGPEYEFGARGEAELLVGDYTGWGVNGSVTGPVGDTEQGAFRLYMGTRNRDGFLSVNTGAGPRTATEDMTRDFWTARFQFLLEPTPDFSFNMAIDYTSRDEICCGAPMLVAGPTAPLVNAVGGMIPTPGNARPFERQVSLNRSTEQGVEDWGIQGQIDYEMENASLTLIAAHRQYDLRSGIDADFSAADIFYRPVDEVFTFENTTFEARLQGTAGRLDWLLGAFYSDEQLGRVDELTYGGAYEPYLSLLLSSGASTGTVAATANGADACARGLGHPTCTAVFAGSGYASPLPAPFSLTPGTAIPAGGGQAGGDRYDQESSSFAVFTHNTFSITDATALTFGLRGTWDEKTMTADFVPSVAPACDVWEAVFGDALAFTSAANLPRLVAIANQLGVTPTTAATIGTVTCLNAARDVYSLIDPTLSRDDTDLSGVLSLSHRFTPDVMGYVSFARGYKAGGFNLDRFNQAGTTPVNFTAILAGTEQYPAGFEPETVNAFEAGLKTEWFDNSLLLNFAAFYSEYENFQLNTFNGLSFFVTSIPGVTVQGGEVEALFFPSDNLTLQGGITYSDAVYDSFPATGTPDVDRLSGQNLSLAPEWYVSGAATWRQPIANNMEWLFHIDGRWVSEQNTGSDLDPEKIQEGYALVNARTGIGAADESWSLELWASNLFDEDYVQVGFDTPLQGGSFSAFLGQPRTVGLTLRARH